VTQADISLISPVTFPPCQCHNAICPDAESLNGEIRESDSATLSALRQRIRRDNEFRHRYGQGRHNAYRT
jgi:hypothetical protein